MRNTTLCQIERDGKYLMMHRIKKAGDENRDKWVGIGGKFEEGESPEECLLREVREETGLRLHSWRFRGLVTFVSDEWGTEYMHLFTSGDFEGEVRQDCEEGALEWIGKRELLSKPIWEGAPASEKNRIAMPTGVGVAIRFYTVWRPGNAQHPQPQPPQEQPSPPSEPQEQFPAQEEQPPPSPGVMGS